MTRQLKLKLLITAACLFVATPIGFYFGKEAYLNHKVDTEFKENAVKAMFQAKAIDLYWKYKEKYPSTTLTLEEWTALHKNEVERALKQLGEEEDRFLEENKRDEERTKRFFRNTK